MLDICKTVLLQHVRYLKEIFPKFRNTTYGYVENDINKAIDFDGLYKAIKYNYPSLRRLVRIFQNSSSSYIADVSLIDALWNIYKIYSKEELSRDPCQFMCDIHSIDDCSPAKQVTLKYFRLYCGIDAHKSATFEQTDGKIARAKEAYDLATSINKLKLLMQEIYIKCGGQDTFHINFFDPRSFDRNPLIKFLDGFSNQGCRISKTNNQGYRAFKKTWAISGLLDTNLQYSPNDGLVLQWKIKLLSVITNPTDVERNSFQSIDRFPPDMIKDKLQKLLTEIIASQFTDVSGNFDRIAKLINFDYRSKEKYDADTKNIITICEKFKASITPLDCLKHALLTQYLYLRNLSFAEINPIDFLSGKIERAADEDTLKSIIDNASHYINTFGIGSLQQIIILSDHRGRVLTHAEELELIQSITSQLTAIDLTDTENLYLILAYLSYYGTYPGSIKIEKILLDVMLTLEEKKHLEKKSVFDAHKFIASNLVTLMHYVYLHQKGKSEKANEIFKKDPTVDDPLTTEDLSKVIESLNAHANIHTFSCAASKTLDECKLLLRRYEQLKIMQSSQDDNSLTYWKKYSQVYARQKVAFWNANYLPIKENGRDDTELTQILQPVAH